MNTFVIEESHPTSPTHAFSLCVGFSSLFAFRVAFKDSKHFSHRSILFHSSPFPQGCLFICSRCSSERFLLFSLLFVLCIRYPTLYDYYISSNSLDETVVRSETMSGKEDNHSSKEHKERQRVTKGTLQVTFIYISICSQKAVCCLSAACLLGRWTSVEQKSPAKAQQCIHTTTTMMSSSPISCRWRRGACVLFFYLLSHLLIVVVCHYCLASCVHLNRGDNTNTHILIHNNNNNNNIKGWRRERGKETSKKEKNIFHIRHIAAWHRSWHDMGFVLWAWAIL